jgi:hypothetical protein
MCPMIKEHVGGKEVACVNRGKIIELDKQSAMPAVLVVGSTQVIQHATGEAVPPAAVVASCAAAIIVFL